MRRAPIFTIYAVAISLLWFPLLFLSNPPSSSIGRAYLAVARFLFIPMYVIQHILSLLIVSLIGPGIVALISTWILAVLAFVAVDWFRLRSR
jgi:hypothetical protein